MPATLICCQWSNGCCCFIGLLILEAVGVICLALYSKLPPSLFWYWWFWSCYLLFLYQFYTSLYPSKIWNNVLDVYCDVCLLQNNYIFLSINRRISYSLTEHYWVHFASTMLNRVFFMASIHQGNENIPLRFWSILTL